MSISSKEEDLSSSTRGRIERCFCIIKGRLNTLGISFHIIMTNATEGWNVFQVQLYYRNLKAIKIITSNAGCHVKEAERKERTVKVHPCSILTYLPSKCIDCKSALAASKWLHLQSTTTFFHKWNGVSFFWTAFLHLGTISLVRAAGEIGVNLTFTHRASYLCFFLT